MATQVTTDPPTDLTSKVSIEDINPEKGQILKRVLFGILRTEIGQNVISQAIDGIPIWDMYEFNTTRRIDLETRREATKLAQVRAAQYQTFDEMFDYLKLNARSAYLYQLAPLHSPFFPMYLLELVAVAIHDLIGGIFKEFHPRGEPPEYDHQEPDPDPKGAVSLATRGYTNTDKYPQGVVDTCHGAYLRPSHPENVFQLQDSQLAEFASVGLENATNTVPNLPFTRQRGAWQRSPREAIISFYIYREPYEREIELALIGEEVQNTGTWSRVGSVDSSEG
ncbi:hypothetical protein FQN54_008978 [Arachnomyces sp. PD_36]|nr:hypothetical protein FQN54_008978 [Arachnomyces sp. PD_36]